MSAEAGIGALFAPPLKLLYKGPFVEARAEAKARKRWLLVNVQSDAVFASHQLNRDVFKDDLVEGLVRKCSVLVGVGVKSTVVLNPCALLTTDRGRIRLLAGPTHGADSELTSPPPPRSHPLTHTHTTHATNRCPRPAPSSTATTTTRPPCPCSLCWTRVRSAACGAPTG